MPRRSFSLYDAKARFSEIVRMVREGTSVTVTVHGEPVAEYDLSKRSQPDSLNASAA